MMLKISWADGLSSKTDNLQNWRESIRVGIGVGLANEPPMTFSKGILERKPLESLKWIFFSRVLYLVSIVEVVSFYRVGQ